jgi:hypothetical protein
MFSRREKTLLIVAAVAVAAAVAFQVLGAAAGRTRGEELRNEAAWKDLKGQVTRLEARLDAETVPESQVVPRVIEAAQTSAAQTGVDLASVRPRKPTQTPAGCLEHGVEIQARGAFPAVARFLYQVEEKHAWLRLTRASITQTSPGTDQVTCTVILAGYSPGGYKK